MPMRPVRKPWLPVSASSAAVGATLWTWTRSRYCWIASVDSFESIVETVFSLSM